MKKYLWSEKRAASVSASGCSHLQILRCLNVLLFRKFAFSTRTSDKNTFLSALLCANPSAVLVQNICVVPSYDREVYGLT